jgi:hypothetical protein
MTIRLFAFHPRREPFETVWTFWGEDAETLVKRLDALGEYRTIQYRNPEIVALMLRRDDKLRTIEGAWTREAVDELTRTLPDKLSDVGEELRALFARTPRAAQRRASG